MSHLVNISLLFLFLVISTSESRGLREEFSWSRINYDWPNQRTNRQVNSRSNYRGRPTNRPNGDDVVFPGNTNVETSVSSTQTPQIASNNASYIYQNNIPMGANIWKDKLFITVPRRRSGVPATLNYVPVNSRQKHNVPLIPYPDWETNNIEGDSNRLVSVYRVAIDPCDRMWFIDTGIIETLGNPSQLQPTALVIIDLNTNRIIKRHELNTTVLRAASVPASITIDTTAETCQNAFAYIPDLAGYGLIVYSLAEDKAWRVNHNYFFLEPVAGEFSIAGHEFQWNDGIFSIALSDLDSTGFRDAYFHSMAGHNLYKVSTRVLRNETLATRSYHEEDFSIVGNRGPLSQTSHTDLHKSSGILFLALVNQNAVGCWNVKTPLRDISIVQKDDTKMIYPSDVKINGDDVVVLTNTMPVFLYGNLNYDVTNFRVWVENVQKAVEGTKCANGRRNSNYRGSNRS